MIALSAALNLVSIVVSFVVVLLFVMQVLYYVYRHLSTPFASYLGKNIKVSKSRRKSLIYKDLWQKPPPVDVISRFGVSV